MHGHQLPAKITVSFIYGPTERTYWKHFVQPVCSRRVSWSGLSSMMSTYDKVSEHLDRVSEHRVRHCIVTFQPPPLDWGRLDLAAGARPGNPGPKLLSYTQHLLLNSYIKRGLMPVMSVGNGIKIRNGPLILALKQEAAKGPDWWPLSKTQAMLTQLLQPSLQHIIPTKPSLLCAALLLVLPPWRACSYGSSVFYVKEDRIINCPVFSYFGNLNSRLFPQWLKTVVNVFQLVRVDQAFQKSLVFFLNLCSERRPSFQFCILASE